MLCKQKCARMQRFGCTRMQTPTAWFSRASFLHQGIGTVCFREGLKGTVVVIDRHMFRESCGIHLPWLKGTTYLDYSLGSSQLCYVHSQLWPSQALGTTLMVSHTRGGRQWCVPLASQFGDHKMQITAYRETAGGMWNRHTASSSRRAPITDSWVYLNSK